MNILLDMTMHSNPFHPLA